MQDMEYKLIVCPPRRASGLDKLLTAKAKASLPSFKWQEQQPKPASMSKNAKRKARRYGKEKTVGHYVGTRMARQACRERWEERLKSERLSLSQDVKLR